MVIMFLNGCFKYMERIWCLYCSSPLQLSSSSVDSLHVTLKKLSRLTGYARERRITTLDEMFKGSRSFKGDDTIVIMSEDAALSTVETILITDEISGMLGEFKSREGRCGAYKCVAACMVQHYQRLHTKAPVRKFVHRLFWNIMGAIFSCSIDFDGFVEGLQVITLIIISILYYVFQYVPAPIALVLFMAAEKGDQHHTSKADVTVSYILLVGAIILDACSFFPSLRYLPEGWIKSVILQVGNSIQRAWSRKQWSEELAQYNIIRNARAVQSSGTIKRFGKRLAFWFDFGTTAHIPITKYHKEAILNNLLCWGATKEWNITTSRGKLALQKWKGNHQDSDSTSAGKELEKSITLDFPISVLIWHIATNILYNYGGNATNGIDPIDRDKKVSKELSNYIMYLVFKCGVRRTTMSQLVHKRASRELTLIFSRKINFPSWDLFEHKEGAQQHLSTDEIQKSEDLNIEQQESMVNKIQKPAERPDNNLLELLQHQEILPGVDPVLPQAYKVALELIGIKDATERWCLILEVWLEMLYYVAPVCGGAFHYEHLSTGGEFITHVLLLMKLLGPFLPHLTT